jgi:diacylglycerol O-acyltransferase
VPNDIVRKSLPSSPVPALVRLTDEDAPFWLLHQALGWSVVQQMLWVFPGHVAEESLREFNDALAQGRLHRRLVDARVPGARPYWVRPSQPVPPAFDVEPIDDTGISDWAVTELRNVELDPYAGRCWRIRTGVTTSGRTVLSLCTLHLVADGRARIDAVRDALRGTTSGAPTNGAEEHPATPSTWADVYDAARQVAAAGLGVARALRQSVRRDVDPTAVDPRPPRSPLAERAPTATPVWATASVAVEDWDRTAERHGGTANSLFIAVVAGLLRAAGYTSPDNPVKVGVPVADRTGEDDMRGNAVAGVTVYLTPVPSPATDLGRVRNVCRDAYTRLAEGRRPALTHLRPLAWLVPPSRIAGKGAPDAGYPDAVASNVGQLPPELLTIGGLTADDVTVRGHAQGVVADDRHRYGEGVQAWLTRTEGHTTFTVSGFDETHFVDDETFGALLSRELTEWGLAHRMW